MTQNTIDNSASDLTVDNLFLDGNTVSSTSGNIVLSPDSTIAVTLNTSQVAVFANTIDAPGITFDSGTNNLTNYTEGTWTPVLEFGGGTSGITYDQQVGRFTRIGRLVFYTFKILLNTKGSSSGNATITGFPVTVGASGSTSDVIGRYSQLTVTGTNATPFINVAASSTTGALQRSASGVGTAALTDDSFVNTTRINGTGYYEA